MVLAGLVTGFLWSQEAAQRIAASNFGSIGTAGVTGTTNGVWLTENSTFTVYKIGLTAPYAAGVSSALNDEYNPISGFIAPHSTQTFCNDTGADACVYDTDYGDNGFNGWNACWGTTSGSHPNQTCSVTWVRINLHYSPPAQRIACHELGHAVGLRHTLDSGSCLRTTASGGTSQSLAAHDVAHIEAAY